MSAGATSASKKKDALDVAVLAYAFWEERVRNNVAGSAEEDWCRAEQALEAQSNTEPRTVTEPRTATERSAVAERSALTEPRA
jgi:hypothetical protein